MTSPVEQVTGRPCWLSQTAADGMPVVRPSILITRSDVVTPCTGSSNEINAGAARRPCVVMVAVGGESSANDADTLYA